MTNKNNNPFLRFLAENNMSKSMESYKNNTMDWQSLFEMQRRNAHAWSQAGQVTMKNLQSIAEKQRMLASQITRDSSNLAKEAINSEPEQKLEANAEIIKNWTDQAAKNVQEVSLLVKKSQDQAGKILSKRMAESMDEMKSSITPNCDTDSSTSNKNEAA